VHFVDSEDLEANSNIFEMRRPGDAMILAGDVGGTKVNLGLFEERGGKLSEVALKRFPSQGYPGLEKIMEEFLRDASGRVAAASFGIAGPVVNNTVKATNLPWMVDGAVLARELGIQRVRLLNDLEAAAYGVGVLGPADLETLHAGVSADANRVVIAAGTGLGEGILFWDGKHHVPIATEGGHADFAPATEQQAQLWMWLKKSNPNVSNELILAGKGFKRLHEFLDGSVRHDFDDASVDAAPGITQRGLAGTCQVCVKTIELFCEIYGSEAGNMAVRAVARGGIYITGGIAVKILPKLKDGRFVAAVKNKEKMGAFLEQIPIRVVLNEKCPLLGAAYVAWKGL
jgi:glucokinase